MGRLAARLLCDSDCSRGVAQRHIEEDLTAGEHVLSYNVTLDGVLVANGTSIGHKRIDFFEGGALKGKELTLTVGGDDGAALARVAVHNCSRIPGSTGCDIVQDFRYTIYDDITIKTLRRSYLEQCCDACRRDSTCAVFVLDAESICTLLSMNHGGESAKGAVSGSPKGGAAFTFVV